jgi:hypothetical protein
VGKEWQKCAKRKKAQQKESSEAQQLLEQQQHNGAHALEGRGRRLADFR